MHKHFIRLVWLAPLLLHSMDANAWGLLTHVYFAQWLVWTLPLLDPNLRRAVQRFPDLVLAGACLPDLALVSPTFHHTHQWESCQDLLRCAHTDEEIAISVGYASHLFVDVVAHNHFVPAHEAMWLKGTLLTHVAGEWAVDAHLAPLLSRTPHQLLQRHHDLLAPFLARRFRCNRQRAAKALRRLAAADRLLRAVRLPQLLYTTFSCLDRRVFDHFVYYISQTQAMLPQIDSLFAGTQPVWEADPKIQDRNLLSQLRQRCLAHLRARHPAPIEHFSPGQLAHNMKEILAINTPITAPASTSVG
ncbi:MAG TPA: zinc dependent phospholipase C family protein [Novimethylophilus sp.]|uniref:zinc dependent phospholipase C family protein n=1 Tax=Novimethylophilus sp. TaxID=2137426 RepID=UPI002F411DEE